MKAEKGGTALAGAITAPGYCFKEPLTVKEAAAFTGLAAGTLYNLVNRNGLTFYKPFGEKGKVYFRRSELERFLFRNRNAADYAASEAADALLNGEVQDGG